MPFDFSEQIREEEKEFNFNAEVKKEEPEELTNTIPFVYGKKTLLERLGLPENADGNQIRQALSPTAQRDRGLIGVGRGITDRVEGVQQFGLEAKQILKIISGMKEFGDPNIALEKFNREALAERGVFEKSPVAKSVEAGVGRTAGSIAPLLAIPGSPTTALGLAGASTAVGALEGVTRFTMPGEDRIGNTIAGAQWGLGGGLGFAGVVRLANVLRGSTGLVTQHPEVAELNRMVQRAKDRGLKVESLMIHQKSPENMISGRFGAQAESTSKAAQHKLASQQASVLPAMKDAKGVDVSRYQAGKVVLSTAEKAYKGKLEKIKNALPRVTGRKAGKALKKGMEDFTNKSRKHVSNLYSKVDEAAKAENPIYDLTYAKDTSSDIRKLVLADRVPKEAPSPIVSTEGVPLRDTPIKTDPINVAATPEGRLITLLDDIDSVAERQASYEVIKQLRTRAGDLIETWPWDASINKGQAKRVYRVLSEIMNNPVNSAPKTVQTHMNASSAARARFEALDAPSVRKIMQSDNPFKISKEFGEIGGLTDEVMGQINKWSPQKGRVFKDYVKNNKILMEGDSALENISQWQQKDPEAYRWLLSKKIITKETGSGFAREEANLINLAVKTDEIRNSNIGVLVKAQVKAKEAVRTLLGQPGTSQADIDKIIKSFGGPGTKGHDALRAGIYEDIIDRTIDEGRFGPILSKNKLNEVIREYENSGAINILNREDRIKVRGLQSYLRLIMMRGKDPGVSLEAAQAISNLKHPATFISGVHQLSVNSIMARILMSERLSGVVFGTGAKAWQVPGNAAMKSGAIMDAFLQDYEEQIQEEQQ